MTKIEEKMEIILLKNIEKVGRKFEVATVKNGYGRNYLIPQGLAIIANDANRNSLDAYKRREAAKLEAKLDEFREIATKIKGKTLEILVKCGTSGRIFGSVTTIQLAKALKEQLEVEVDRRDILLPDNIKEIGDYTAPIDLHPDVDARIDFHVKPDDPKVAAIIAENKAKEAEEEARTLAERAARERAEAEAAEEQAAPVADAETTTTDTGAEVETEEG